VERRERRVVLKGERGEEGGKKTVATRTRGNEKHEKERAEKLLIGRQVV